MQSKTKRLTESAMLIAVAIVLELVSKMIIPEMPFGGQITMVSMLPVVLISYRHGVKWGLTAGFGYALYSIFSRYAIQRGYHPMTITFYTFLLSAVGGVFFTDFPLIAVSSAENGLGLWLPLVGYVAVGTVGAYLLYTAGLKYIDNSKAAVMAAVEPACATLLQIVVVGVMPDAITLVGILLVLAAIVLLNVGTNKT